MGANDLKTPGNEYRPLEIVHDFEFAPIHLPQDLNTFKGSPCEEEKAALIAERLARLARLGYGGVVLNVCFRRYLRSEESWRLLVRSVDAAKALGLRVMIYDERYYPSGIAGGETIADHPEYEAKILAMVVGLTDPNGTVYVNSPHGCGSLLYAFAYDGDTPRDADFSSAPEDVSRYTDFGGGLLYRPKNEKKQVVFCFFGSAAFEHCRTSHTSRTIRRYADTLSPEAVDRFFEVTHRQYISRIKDFAGKIEAFFTDEPQLPGKCAKSYSGHLYEDVTDPALPAFRFVSDYPDNKKEIYPYIPWTPELPRRFRERTGKELAPSLPALFCADIERGKALRRDFWCTVSDMFGEAYGAAYAKLCHENGVCYSGHLLDEENIVNHPWQNGDLLRQLGYMDIPGCDMLTTVPSSILGNIAAVKLASSAAHIYGKKGVFTEASDIHEVRRRDRVPYESSLAWFIRGVMTQIILGVTTVTSYYGDKTLPDNDLRHFCDVVGRASALARQGALCRECLIYYPFEQLAAYTRPTDSCDRAPANHEKALEYKRFVNALAQMMTRTRIDYDYVNDDALPGVAFPSFFILPDVDTLPESTAEYLERAADSGCKVLCAGQKHPIENCAVAPVFLADEAAVAAYLRENGAEELSLDIESGEIICMHRQEDEQDIFLLQNCSDSPVTCAAQPKLRCARGALREIDLDSGEITESAFSGRIPLCLQGYGVKAFALR